jgi:hypothetical protein
VREELVAVRNLLADAEEEEEEEDLFVFIFSD